MKNEKEAACSAVVDLRFKVHFNLYQLYRCQELGAMFLS